MTADRSVSTKIPQASCPESHRGSDSGGKRYDISGGTASGNGTIGQIMRTLAANERGHI